MKMNAITSELARGIGSVCLLAWIQAAAFGQTSHMVEVSNYKFSPADIIITAGDTVIWTNTQGSHNVDGQQSTYPGNPESFGNDVGTGWVFSHVFTLPGTYDYVCDPHITFGMTGTVTVLEPAPDSLTIHINGMSPHTGETWWILITDKTTGAMITRTSGTVVDSFVLAFGDITAGHDFKVDFFVDHNGNGFYDAPPADHAWRFELEHANGNEVLDFTHNTDFTDIMWMHRLRISFSGMVPHLGEMLTLYIRDLSTGTYLDTLVLNPITEEAFDLESYVIEPGHSYIVDLYADHNGNGMYDAPPVDHVWRLETGEITGDKDLVFVHNTDFTDIFETTGLEPGVSRGMITLYPNPAREILHIQSDMEIGTVSFYNILGTKVSSENGQGSGDLLLSLDRLRPGYYIVEIKTEDGRQAFSRLIKE
jgi:plastocyanin